MTKFQIILLGVFAFFIVGGLIIFSAFKGKQPHLTPTITIWGTLDQSIANGFLQQASSNNGQKYHFIYYQKRPDRLYQDYVEALVSNVSPDVLLMSHDELLKYRSKIAAIPYDSYNANTFKSTFIQEGELYLDPRGVLGLPFTVDPLVLYWNRDMFSNGLVSNPPNYWEEFLSIAPKLTQKDAANNIIRSGAALGEYGNIAHAKEILSTLMIQAGTPIVARNGNGFTSVLSNDFDMTMRPADAALTFYTQFADPVKQVYSWNRSLPDSKTLFISNKLALYIGYASEFSDIVLKNPNLNFGVTTIPQPRPSAGANAKTPVNSTYGKMYGLSVTAGSRIANDALDAIKYLTSADVIPMWVAASGLPSVRRDALSVNSSQSASTIFSISALWSRGWYDPDPSKTATIFQNMVGNVTSGRLLSNEAVDTASLQLQNLFR